MIKKISLLSMLMMTSFLCAADHIPDKSTSSEDTLAGNMSMHGHPCFEFLKQISLPKHSRMRAIFERKYRPLETIEQTSTQSLIMVKSEFIKDFCEAYRKIHDQKSMYFLEQKKNHSLISDIFMSMGFAQQWTRYAILKNNILWDAVSEKKLVQSSFEDMHNPGSKKTLLSELGLKCDNLTLRSTEKEWELGIVKDQDNNIYQFVLNHDDKPLDISCFKIKNQPNLFCSDLYTPEEQAAFVDTNNLDGKVTLTEVKHIQAVNLLIEHAYYHPTIASSVDCKYKTNVFLANYKTIKRGEVTRHFVAEDYASVTKTFEYEEIPTAPRAILLYEWPNTLLTYSSTYEQIKDRAYICVSPQFRNQSQLLHGRIKYFNECVIPFQNFNVPESQGEYTSNAHKLFIEREALQTYLNELFKNHNADLITVQNPDGSSMHYAQDPRQFLPLTSLLFKKIGDKKAEQVEESVSIKEETPVKQEIRVKQEPKDGNPKKRKKLS